MKKLFYSLCFLLITFQFFSQETEKLPKVPWEEIVEIKNQFYTPLRKWKQDIKVKLKGNYTSKDSLDIARALNKLDSLTETISIKFSENPFENNLRINFIDTTNSKRNNIAESRFMFGPKQSIHNATIKIYNYERNIDINFEELIKVEIARVLISGHFSLVNRKAKRASFFNPNKIPKLLNKNDIAIIKEVYKPNFKDNLKIAEVRYKHVIASINKDMAEARNHKLWWVRNPFSVIILPALLLILFSIYFLGKLKKFLSTKIKKDWLRFGILMITFLFFADIIIILSVSSFDFLTIPDDYSKVPFIRFDTIISTIIFSLLALPVLFLFRFIETKIQEKANSILVKTFFIFASTGFLPFVFLCILAMISAGERVNNQEIYKMLANSFVVLMIIATIRALISYFIFKEKKLILDNELEISNLRELKTKAELKSLQAQINPHFLYNSLNSIASLAKIDAEKTQKMAYSLSDLFKYSINRKDKRTNTIKDEVEMVKTYLEIEKIRFEDRLQFTLEVDTIIENKEIPMFLIQPLVENAIKHGISKNVGQGNINLKIERKEKNIYFSVYDNGPDFPDGLISGHGLQTVYDLLRLNYKDNASLNWTNTPKKMIMIQIPDTV